MTKSQKIALMEQIRDLRDEIKHGKLDEEGIRNIDNMIDSILEDLIKMEVM